MQYRYRVLIRSAGYLLLVLSLQILLSPAQAEERYPLEPIDTSSPRATLTGLLSNVDAAFETFRDVYWHSPSRALHDRIFTIAADALRTLDLSQVAPSTRIEVGYDAATYLYETLSRIELPPIEEIPGAAFYEGTDGPVHWTVPHTNITISRVTEGPRKGEFLFNAATVNRSEEFYLKTRSLPYTRDVPIENSNQLRQVVPGWWGSMAMIERLPGWARVVVLDHAIWKWIAFALLLIIVISLVVMVHRLSRHNMTDNPVSNHLRNLLTPLFILIVNPFAAYILTDQVNLIGSATKAVLLASGTVEYLVATWVAWLGSLLIAELIILSPRVPTDSLNAQLLRLTARIMGIVLGLVIIFYGANQIGLPIVGVLAGVGVSGLAIALAAQDSLKNLLGSLMIFMDQPYKPGQRIVVQGHDGFVEEIGLRSTKIRMLTGALTAIPNEKMASLDVENIGRRKFIRRQTSIRLANDTPVDRIETAIGIIKDILQDHEGMRPELPPRVFFDEFNPDSLNIMISYWYHPPRRWKSLAFDEQVNLNIILRFTTENIRLACPTSKTLLSQEQGGSLHFVSSTGNNP
jgi:MscS family membrane protein